jgi:mannose-1-phosphate guanylyltransferase/mannose-6-phosphate isomerase
VTKILPIIMCGGAGTRLWPVSRDSLPKQFIPLVGVRSTFQTLIQALAASDQFLAPVVITNHDYRFLVAEQLAEVGACGQIVLEPMRRDSGPAVAVAAELAFDRQPDMVVALLAADHAIGREAEFLRLCGEAASGAARGHIVTFGIRPSVPATAYGYIRPGKPIDGQSAICKVEAFVEKPDRATAERYIAEGYLWNSGNFVFRADVMRAEITKFEPAMADCAARAVAGAQKDLNFLVLEREAFAQATRKSIDYAVMERTDKAAVLPADYGWSDIGGWTAVGDLAARDEAGNAVQGNGLVVEGRNVYVRSPDLLTTVVGLDDIIVVTTTDAVLVVKGGEAEKVKSVVAMLKERRRPEATAHPRVYRPWGYFQSVDSGERYQVKRIVVKPGQRLSLQKHHHRAEHWIVVKGAAEVTRGEDVHVVHENESIYLPIGSIHRLANPGKIDLELIEVQTGSYLGEDDIIRIEDVYNRS